MQADHNGHSHDIIQAQSITEALNASLNPQTSSEIRREALEYLERVKIRLDAPLHGFALAQDRSHSQAVRYYGLQLLEHAVKYSWSDYDDTQTEQVRMWIVTLAHELSPEDALFHRNKIAQLWVECAKRCWGEQWLNMDAMLVEIWDWPTSEKQPVHKLLVLYIIEMLAEDICNKEDAAAGLRLEILGSALNEIVIPEQLHRLHSQDRGQSKHAELRCGSQGWLARICNLTATCIKHARLGDEGSPQVYGLCATKAMNTLRALVAWVSLKGIAEANCTECLFLAFHIEDTVVRIAAAETLYAILVRPSTTHFQDIEDTILQQALQTDKISLLEAAWQHSTQLAASDDDEVYILQKKISETICTLLEASLQRRSIELASTSLKALAGLSIAVLQHESLLVSIPVLHSWSKILASHDRRFVGVITQALSTLVEICSERLTNYELLPEDLDLPTVRFLYQDFESMPERHAFMGNYRRYCTSILESISRQRPMDAITHALGQMQTMLESGPYSNGQGFDSQAYSKTGFAVLQFDAQFYVVLSVVKGYCAWDADGAMIAQDDPTRTSMDQQRQIASQTIQEWCMRIMALQVDDPEVSAHVLTILSNIVRSTRCGREMVLPVAKHILSVTLLADPAAVAYAESAKGFEALRVLEAQKLAMAYPDELFEYYDGLQTKTYQLIQMHSDDDRIVWGFRAFLFVIVQRTSRIDDQTRLQKLREMVDLVYSSWQDPSLEAALSDQQAFCKYLALENLTTFYDEHGFARVEDWTSQQLNTNGQARQAQIKAALDNLPLRMTKAMLAATTEKLREDSNTYAVACTLWETSVQTILPKLLQMLRHVHALGHPKQWSHFTPEIQAVFRRTSQDRFWQSGISNESKDEFYARVSGSKSSYEGFASTVRGTLRNIREQCYHIIFLITKFEQQFYGLAELPEPLASAMFDDAEGLSTHHLQPVINLATGLVQRCPPQHRQSFLPPLLVRMFTKLDAKISGDWGIIVRANEHSAEYDDLSEEMRLESVLRQLTFSMVAFVAFLLEQDKPPSGSKSASYRQNGRPTIASIVLQDRAILEPLILFCTHALRMRDTRCCTWICKLFGSMIPVFTSSDAHPAPQVREFISTEVLKAGITSLNEPYFVDMQKDLGTLLAQIIESFHTKTPTPRLVLLSLPNMQESKVDQAIDKISRSKSARQQRALILGLLEGVRGISIHESGKIARPGTNHKPKVQTQYIEVEQKATIVNGAESGLDSIADLFGDA